VTRKAPRNRTALIEPPSEILARILCALHRDIDKPAPPVTLGTTDFDWLVALLERIANGEDVSEDFRRKRRGRPPDDNHVVFVALDVALRRRELGKVAAARTAVAKDWKLQAHDVKRAEQTARPVVSKLLEGADIAALARMVAWHRERHLGQKLERITAPR
jgi:hypothetical protein